MNDQSIDVPSHEESTSHSKPLRITILALFMVAALTLSYLFAYSVAGALVDSNVLPHWLPGNDPRPGWMACLFITLFGSAVLVWALAGRRSQLSLGRADTAACGAADQ